MQHVHDLMGFPSPILEEMLEPWQDQQDIPIIGKKETLSRARAAADRELHRKCHSIYPQNLRSLGQKEQRPAAGPSASRTHHRTLQLTMAQLAEKVGLQPKLELNDIFKAITAPPAPEAKQPMPWSLAIVFLKDVSKLGYVKQTAHQFRLCPYLLWPGNRHSSLLDLQLHL